MTNSRTPWAKALARIAFLALALGLIVPGGLAFAEEGEEGGETEEAELPWVNDVREAMAQAQREGKDLFINFTGSDWCGWCMRLDEEVFAHSEFIDEATKKYVFVYLDFPRAAELKEAVADPELNNKLKDEYAVAGFPTIILTTADGTPYGRLGYQRGGPSAYMETLNTSHDGGTKVKALLKDEKLEDKQCLKDAFEVLATNDLLNYPKFTHLVDAAEKADPDGSLGLKALAQKEREKRMAVDEEKKVHSFFPARGSSDEPQWDEIHKALLESKFWTGPGFLNATFMTAKWLTDEGRAADAKALLEAAKRDPLLGEHPRAKEIFDNLMTAAEEAMAGGGDDDDEDDGGMDDDK